jgi:elongation factor Ts
MSTTEAVKIDAKQVKELREKSGAPMGDCLKALQEAKGDMENAFVVLRKRGMASAAKKASRTTNEGAVGTYIHAGGKIGVLIELNCESDFVARTEDFQELLRDIAMHIAATDPRFVGRDEVTAGRPRPREGDLPRPGRDERASREHRREDARRQAGEVLRGVLPARPAVHQGASQTIAQLIASKVAKLGENISVRRFARFKGARSALCRRFR